MEIEMNSGDLCLQNTKGSDLSEIPGTSTFSKSIDWHHNYPDIIFDFAYEWDIVSDRLEWYGKVHERLGYVQAEFPSTLKEWQKIIHPDDIEQVKKAIHLQLKTGELYLLEYWVQRKDGNFTSVIDYGTALSNNSGTPYEWVGVMKV